MLLKESSKANSVEIIYKGEGWTILIPKTEEASIYWGKGTKWDVSDEDRCCFRNYKIFIFFIHGEDDKYLWYLEDYNSFVGASGKNISLLFFMKETLPPTAKQALIKWIFKEYRLKKSVIKLNKEGRFKIPVEDYSDDWAHGFPSRSTSHWVDVITKDMAERILSGESYYEDYSDDAGISSILQNYEFSPENFQKICSMLVAKDHLWDQRPGIKNWADVANKHDWLHQAIIWAYRDCSFNSTDRKVRDAVFQSIRDAVGLEKSSVTYNGGIAFVPNKFGGGYIIMDFFVGIGTFLSNESVNFSAESCLDSIMRVYEIDYIFECVEPRYGWCGSVSESEFNDRLSETLDEVDYE